MEYKSEPLVGTLTFVFTEDADRDWESMSQTVRPPDYREISAEFISKGIRYKFRLVPSNDPSYWFIAEKVNHG